MKIIKGFENEEIEVSDFGEWVGKDYIDYKFEYENNQKVIKELFKENQKYKELFKENQKYKEVINRAVKFIEDDYYSLNTTDINSIAMTSNKLLQVRNILKGVE